jgi:hypothetical protein
MDTWPVFLTRPLPLASSLLLLVASTACAGGGKPQAERTVNARMSTPSASATPTGGHWTEGEDPLIIIRDMSTSYLMGEKRTLGYETESKCLVLLKKEGHSAIVWPKGTHPINHNGRRGVDVPELGPIYVGDKLSMVGGYEFWGKQPPAKFHLKKAAKCIKKSPDGEVFIAGRLESVERTR